MGEMLYIPSFWFHYIISQDASIQCNARSGESVAGKEEISKCGFLKRTEREHEEEESEEEDIEEEEENGKGRHHNAVLLQDAGADGKAHLRRRSRRGHQKRQQNFEWTLEA